MCGRFNFTDDELDEIKEIIREVNSRLYSDKIKMGEIYPTNLVPVLVPEAGRNVPQPMTWGFPHFRGSGVIINAKSETVTEKPMFRNSVFSRRCIVPSSGFYEWRKEPDGSKTKFIFHLPDTKLLYMAGVWNHYKDGDGAEQNRFVILTTEANDSMKAVHNRMPVVLRPGECMEWLSGDFAKLFDRSDIPLVKEAV